MSNLGNRNRVQVEGLESRTFLSGAPFGGFHFPRFVPQPPSAAVQADLATIKTDQQKLAADRSALATKLQADRQAIADAVKALDSQLAPLRAELQKDAKAWHDALLADFKALVADKGDATKVAADKAKIKADQAAARTELSADQKAIRDLIGNDPAVKAARAKLTADSKPITDDLAKLKADYQQLAADIKAQRDGTGTTAGGTTATA